MRIPRGTHPPIFASLDFMYSAIGHDGDLLRPSTLTADVGNHVQGLDAVDDVSKDTRELGVHVCQDNAKLGRNLKRKKNSLNLQLFWIVVYYRLISGSIPNLVKTMNIGLLPHLV